MSAWKRREVFGDATLYLGDCLEVMADMPRESVIVTDPTYGINHASNRGATWAGRKLAGDHDTTTRDAALTGWPDAAAFGSWKTPPIADAKGCLVWDKGPAFGMGDLRFPWKGSWELIYLRGKCWRGRRDEGVLRGHLVVSWESQGRTHPTEKPVSLMAHIIGKAPAQRTILDPFMGSGTTGVACMNLGRKFIGIEIEEKYFDIACRRIDLAARQERLALGE